MYYAAHAVHAHENYYAISLCDMHASVICSARLRSRLGEDTLDYAVCIYIEVPEKLNNSELDAIVQNWKHQKKICIIL